MAKNMYDINNNTRLHDAHVGMMSVAAITFIEARLSRFLYYTRDAYDAVFLFVNTFYYIIFATSVPYFVCDDVICIQCRLWVHKMCCGISGKLQMTMEVDYKCSVCVTGVSAINENNNTKDIVLGQDSLECVDTFCHLGDMIDVG